MPYRKPLINNQVYHVFNRGINKNPIFNDAKDYNRLIYTLAYYLNADRGLTKISTLSETELLKLVSQGPRSSWVNLICYCLMPNHFHLLLEQNLNNGISTYLRKVTDSYTRYYNTRHNRTGPLFNGTFKAVRIENDNQLLHISRYIHLNPITSSLVKNLKSYPWSSYPMFINKNRKSIIPLFPKIIINHFSSYKEYENFVLDYQDYAQTLNSIKNQLLDS